MREQDENCRLARRWFAEGWNDGNVAVADEVFDTYFVLNGDRVGPEGPRRNVAATRESFGDVMVTVETQVADGAWVVTRYTAEGTHTGSFADRAPTGVRIAVTGIAMWRCHRGKVVEDWTEFDQLGLLRQLDLATSRLPLSAGAS